MYGITTAPRYQQFRDNDQYRAAFRSGYCGFNFGGDVYDIGAIAVGLEDGQYVRYCLDGGVGRRTVPPMGFGQWRDSKPRTEEREAIAQ